MWTILKRRSRRKRPPRRPSERGQTILCGFRARERVRVAPVSFLLGVRCAKLFFHCLLKKRRKSTLFCKSVWEGAPDLRCFIIACVGSSAPLFVCLFDGDVRPFWLCFFCFVIDLRIVQERFDITPHRCQLPLTLSRRSPTAHSYPTLRLIPTLHHTHTRVHFISPTHRHCPLSTRPNKSLHPSRPISRGFVQQHRAKGLRKPNPPPSHHRIAHHTPRAHIIHTATIPPPLTDPAASNTDETVAYSCCANCNPQNAPQNLPECTTIAPQQTTISSTLSLSILPLCCFTSIQIQRTARSTKPHRRGPCAFF